MAEEIIATAIQKGEVDAARVQATAVRTPEKESESASKEETAAETEVEAKEVTEEEVTLVVEAAQGFNKKLAMVQGKSATDLKGSENGT